MPDCTNIVRKGCKTQGSLPFALSVWVKHRRGTYCIVEQAKAIEINEEAFAEKSREQ